MPWSIRTEGTIALYDGEGHETPLAYRKVGELLVALFQAPGHRLDRYTAGNALWPNRSYEARQTNLRQALTHLRAAVGAHNILTDRLGCGFAPEFEVVSVDASPVREENVGEALLRFLEFLVPIDPAQMIDTLRVNHDMAIDLDTPRIVAAIATARTSMNPNNPLMGWVDYFGGFYGMANVPEAREFFGRALKAALKDSDRVLASRSAYWLCACNLLVGRHDRAVGLIDLADSRKWPATHADAALLSMKGTVLLHAGNGEESAKAMREASYREFASPRERNQHNALRALYLATSGNIDDAQAIESVLGGERGCSTGAVGALRLLTQSVLEAIQCPESAIATLPARIHEINRQGFGHFELYARETLAVASAKVGDRKGAAKALRQSTAMRRSMGLTYTAWDQHRLVWR